MNRNIELNYKLNKEKTALTINFIEEKQTGFTCIIKEYNLSHIDDSAELYNVILEDLNAEYDNELATLIDKLINKIDFFEECGF